MADAITILQRLHQHRAWVNQNVLMAAEPLSDDQRHQLFPIGQGSIWKSLIHLFAAEYVWLEALLGNENAILRGDLPGRIPGNQEGEGGIASFAELKREWSQLAGCWSDYLASLSEKSMDEPVYRVAASTGARLATRRSDVLLHVCTHSQYTTAQIVNMLRQVGVMNLPETMLISLARHEKARETL